jgi:L-gulonolactone oxidase
VGNMTPRSLQQSNWSGNQKWTPSAVIEPRNKEDLISFLSTTTSPIRAVGTLHSFSDCLKTTGTMIRMTNLNKLLHVDLEKKQITVEAGIILEDLYEFLHAHELALDGIPNTADVTLAGAICNCTHGTGIESGTLCDSVVSIEVLTAKGESLRASRDDEKKDLFEALLVGGGFFSIIYSVTLQCINAYKSLVMNGVFLASEITTKLSVLLASYDSVNIHYSPCLRVYDIKTRVRIPNRPFLQKGKRFLSFEKACADIGRTIVKGNLLSNPICFKLLEKALNTKMIRKALSWQGVLDWDKGELIERRAKFINVEYGIPLQSIDTFFPEVLKIVKKFESKGYKRIWQLVMRPVKADRYGFLCATKGRDTCFFDMSLQDGSPLEHLFFQEVEDLILAYNGRVSWSRRFVADPSKIRANYPEFDRYLEIMKPLDPEGRFSNDFTSRLFWRAP